VTYEIIDSGTPDRRLTTPPAQVWVICTLEIAVHETPAHPHLLVTYPSYPLGTGAEHDEGYWATPFLAYPVNMGYSPPTTIRSLRRQIDATMADRDPDGDINQLADLLGLRDIAVDRLGDFIEVKMSPRTPELVKAFKVIRYGLSAVDDACLRNIADPDLRRGYAFLPLDPGGEFLHERYSEAHRRREQWFLGKPLMSHIQHVLATPSLRATLASSSIALSRELFARSESGLLVAVDLAGYGTALKYAREQMHSFGLDAKSIQAAFRKSIGTYFDRMLGRLGAMQVQTAGDGFLAAFPFRVFGDVVALVDDLLAQWRLFVGEIGELNKAIREEGLRVGSRMALHFGDYEYGRIGGVNSYAPAFDGASIVEVARLEQGLASAMRGGYAVEEGQALQPKRHYVIVSRELRDRLGDSWSVAPADRVGVLDLEAKEFRDRAEVWEVRPS
jgi:class 3 adenylate cyclase